MTIAFLGANLDEEAMSQCVAVTGPLGEALPAMRAHHALAPPRNPAFPVP